MPLYLLSDEDFNLIAKYKNIFLWLNRYNYLMSRIKEGGVHFNGANTLSAHQCEAAKRIIMPLLSKGKVNNMFKDVFDVMAYLHCQTRTRIPIRVQIYLSQNLYTYNLGSGSESESKSVQWVQFLHSTR